MLPCAVVVDSEDVVSDVVVLLEPNVVVEAVVAGFEVVDDVVGVVSVDDVDPSDVVDVLLVAAVVVVSVNFSSRVNWGLRSYSSCALFDHQPIGIKRFI